MKSFYLTAILYVLTLSCSQSDKLNDQQTEKPLFYLGADLSYVNEMIDCGGVYKDQSGLISNPYDIFKNAGANLVRLRLWHSPKWTNYSTLKDVERAMHEVKSRGLDVLLDFHYSDTWADPHKQITPESWLEVREQTNILGDSVYDYTYKTLSYLHDQKLLPEMVQIGNETNIEILKDSIAHTDINWERNAFLLNKGIQAVKDFSSEQNSDIQIMLHVAQPENAMWWFDDAIANGILDFDLIGLSYYPKWSTHKPDQLATAIEAIQNTFEKPVMIVETAYPFTFENLDEANNILGEDSLIEGFPATQDGQLDYLNFITEQVQKAKGLGVIYWEPGWISTSCKTLWGQGSHWDNAVLFDADGMPTKGMQFFRP